MATFVSGPHQSPQESLPPFAYKIINTATWGAGGNSSTITDPSIKTNSRVDIWVTGATAQAGQWALAITNGQCVITSSSSESSTLPISYIVY